MPFPPEGPTAEIDLDSIRYEMEGAAKAEERIQRFFEAGPGVTRSGGGGPARPLSPTAGRHFVALWDPEPRRRFETLLHFERGFPAGSDHGYLIGPACHLVERELERLVAEPARSIANHLASALRAAGRGARSVEALESWAEGRTPTMFGVVCVILQALHLAESRGVPPVVDFLDSEFEPSYRKLLQDGKPHVALDRVRDQFRNPCCHGLRSFHSGDYDRFVRLVVNSRRFTDWDRAGPRTVPPEPGTGVLHHHLNESRRVGYHIDAGATAAPDDATPLERLLDPALDAASAVRVDAKVKRLGTHAAAARDGPRRDLVATPKTPSFRAGDLIGLEFQASADCHLTIIDVATSGRVVVLWPNAWHPDSAVPAGRVIALPSLSAPEFELRVGGAPGEERLIALATLDPLASLVPPVPGGSFRELDPLGQKRLVEEVLALPPDRLGVGRCRFTIVAS